MLTLSRAEIRYLLTLMGYDGPSAIRPDPSFTGQDALALAERLKAELEKAK